MPLIYLLLSLLLLTIPPHISYAADLFNVTINVSGYTPVSIQTPNANQALDYFKEPAIANAIPGYSGIEPVAILFDYQGIKIEYEFFTMTGTQLKINIPSLKLNKTFTGKSRDDSRRQAFDYLKSKGYLALLVEKLQKVTVENSASSPVAGNPQSLLGNLVQNDFDQQFLLRISQPERDSEVGAGFRIGSVDEDGATLRSRSLTPFYRYQSDKLLSGELTLSLPLSITEVSNAQSYQAGAALSFRKAIREHWSLATGATYAITGSNDALQSAQYGGASITSDLHWNVGIWRVAMGNMIGNYRTFRLAGYDPELRNTAFRNALVASHPIEILGKEIHADYFIIDTRYTGSALKKTDYQEAGIAWSGNTEKSSWRASLNLISTPKISGIANLLWSF